MAEIKIYKTILLKANPHVLSDEQTSQYLIDTPGHHPSIMCYFSTLPKVGE